MATRFYFHPVGGTPTGVTPSSWSAGWNKTSGASADAPALLSASIGAAGANKINAGSGTSGHFTACARFVSSPLLAQTISGTVKGQTRALETAATENYTLAFAIKVIKPDGTDRGVLVGTSASDDTSTTPPELATSSTNRSWRDASESASISLSSLGVSLGDRLVIELGYRQASTSVANGSVNIAAFPTFTDLAENDTTTTSTTNPWCEFSQTLKFATAYFGSAATPAGNDTLATGVADPTAVTPPTGMLAGDLVVMIGHQRLAAAALAVSATGGQTWNSLTAIGGTTITARVFWCQFNGTWSANPSVDFSAVTCNSVQMHVFRPADTSQTWSVNQAQVELDIAAGTGVHTITGQTTTGTDPTVTLAGWFTADDNTWGTTSGTGWQLPGDEYYVNSSGSDQSSTYAYKLQTAAGATGNVSRTQTAVGPDASTSFIITFAATVPATAKTLTADTVAFSFTGDTTTTLELGRELVPEAGSYAFAGQDVNFRKGLILVLGAGGYNFAGQDVTLDRTYKLIPEAGSFSFAGQTASLEHGWELVPEAGSYSFAGQAATFRRTYKLIQEAGSFAFAGQEVTLDRTYRLIVEAGSFSFTGSAATLTYTPVTDEFVLSADAGAFTFAGQTASLEHGWRLVAEATGYSFSGSEASLLHEAAGETILGAGPGSYAFAGTAAALERGYVLVAETFISAGGSPIGLLLTLTGGGGSTYTFSGSPVDLTFVGETVLDVEAGSYAVSGTAATLTYTPILVGFVFTGSDATLTYEELTETVLGADGGSFAFSGQAVTLDRTFRVIAAVGAYSFAGQDVTLDRTYRLIAEVTSYSFSGQQTTLDRTYKVIPEAGSYSFSGTAATLTYTPGLVGFVFTGSDAELTYEPAGQTILGAAGGSFQFSGSDATLTLVRTLELVAEAGAFSFTGSNATLTYVPAPPIAPATTWGGEGAEFWVRKWRKQAQQLKPVVVKPFAEAVNEQAPAQHVIPVKDDRRPDPEFVEFTDFIRLLEKL